LKDRIIFQAHNFWTPQPVKDADVYFIRFCLHDYSDDDAVKNIISAMKHGAKLVVMDTVLPEPNTVEQSQEIVQRYVLGVDVKQKQANLE
jgi:hypothetical protein